MEAINKEEREQTLQEWLRVEEITKDKDEKL